MAGVVQVPLLEQVAGVGEGRHGVAGGVQDGAAAGVVEVQVGEDHQVHVGGGHALPGQAAGQGIPGPHLEAGAEGVRLLVAVAGVHQQRAPAAVHFAAQQQAVGAQQDHVVGVGGAVPVPEHLGHGAEHRAAIKAEGAAADDADVPIAQDHGLLSPLALNRSSRRSSSTGSGKTMVLFFSTAISVRVCR